MAAEGKKQKQIAEALDIDQKTVSNVVKELVAQQLIGSRDEIGPTQPVERGSLGVSWRASRREDG